MSLTRIKEAAENILNRVESVAGRGEEATKQAMILPMIEALGYDIWNPDEVCPEFDADTAVKKAGQKEKVDYAILIGGVPRIFFEVKAAGEALDGHHGQLKRYFMSTSTVPLGILTNGVEYRFFTDTKEQNIQDDAPFHVAKLDAVDQGLEVLARFQKEVFSAESIRDYATELTFTKKIVEFFQREIDIQDGELSDYAVEWVLRSNDMYNGRIMASVVERFRPVAKVALQRVITQIVRRVLSEIDDGVSSPKRASETPSGVPDTSAAPSDDIADPADDLLTSDSTPRRDIDTTEQELECFAVVKRLFDNSVYASRTIFEPSQREEVPIEIGYKDTSAYFGIYFNKPGWWNMRISVESKTKWVSFDVNPESARHLVPNGFEVLPPVSWTPFRVKIESSQDLLTLTDLVFASFEKTINDRVRTDEQQPTDE